MKRRTGVVAWLQYLAIRVAALILQMFPIDANLRTAQWLGALWWRMDKRHRNLARQHLRRSFGPELSSFALDDVARRCFEHWTMFTVEFLSAFRLLNEWSWPRYVEAFNLNETVELLIEKRGAILLTGHFGNFELTAYLLAAVGFDTVAVMRPLDNKYFNDYVVRTRRRRGLQLLDKTGAIAQAGRILQRGGVLGFVADQDAGRKGVFVDFFGRKASTYKSIALLAMEYDVPIAVGYARRLVGFSYRIGIERIIYPDQWRDQADPLLWITQAYTAAIESMVRRAPEQYLWIHRRWKSRPPGERNALPHLQRRVDAAALPT